MLTSILNTIKQMLGLPIDDLAFDQEILAHINSVFMILQQLGVGPDTVYSIDDSAALWGDFLTDPSMYSAVKSYIYLKVKLIFDPSGTSFHLNAMQEQIRELEWRLTEQVPVPPDPIVVVDPGL